MSQQTYFINISGPWGVETIDEFTGDPDGAEYLIGEYRLVYGPYSEHRVFLSSQCTKDWRDRG